jgi:hypothetical protein
MRGALLLAVCVACAPPVKPSAEQPLAVGPKSRVSAPFDVGAVIARVSASFRERNGSFVAHGARLTAAVEKGGRFWLSRSPDRRVGFETLGGNRVAHASADGSVTLDGAAVEQLRFSADGLEQSWRFARRPAGDLQISVRTTGLRFTGATRLGLHFRDGAGRLWRYGVATLIDAHGTRTTVVPRREKDLIVMTVPSSLLGRVAFPAVLDPTISAEEGMDQPIVGIAGAYSGNVSVAFDGAEYFVVWNDTRQTGSSYQVFGARVQPNGTLLDPTGILIGDQYNPRVIFDGVNFLVVWSEYLQYPTTAICGLRVATSGAVLDSAPAFCTLGGSQTAPTAASNGSGTLLVWADHRGASSTIYGARLKADYTLEDPNGFAIGVGTADQLDPAATQAGDHYLVAWDQGGDILAARVRPDGTVLDSPPIAITRDGAGHGKPSLASDGSTTLAAWANSSGTVSAARVRSDGWVLDAGGFAIATGPYATPRTQVAFTGQQYVVVWDDVPPNYGQPLPPEYIWGARVGSDGTLVDNTPLKLSSGNDDAQPVVVSDGGGSAFVAWAHQSVYVQGTSAIDGAILQGDGTEGAPQVISRSANAQHQAAAACTAANCLVVWQDFRNANGGDIYGARLLPDGTVLDTSGIAIATGDGARDQPRVASNGSQYLVVWDDTNTITSYPFSVLGMRLSTDGVLLDPSPLPIALGSQYSHQSSAAVASDGTDYVVAWVDEPNNFYVDLALIMAARVKSDGTVGSAVRLAGTSCYEPQIASNGSAYLVTFVEGPYTYRIHGVLVGPDVTKIKADFAISNVANADAVDQEGPTVASDGANFLVAWQDGRTGVIDYADIYGARVSGDGTPLGDFAVAAAHSYQSAPSATFDGSHYLVAWEDGRLGPTNVFGARVASDGTNLDPDGITLATDPLSNTEPSLASAGPARALVVYERFQSDPGLDNNRVHARSFDDTPLVIALGAACITSSDCTSGHCVDGVCCESACDQSCVACNVGGQEGSCVTVTAPRPGNRPVCAGAGTICGGSCTGSPDCTYPTGVCSVASCSSGAQTTAAQCDGSGNCGSVTTACAPYLCGTNACRTSCKSDLDCASGNYCAAGACVAQKALGVACVANPECSGGHCVDGVCCSSICDEQCAACNLMTSLGSCTPIMGKPVGNRPTCNSDGSSCGGTCAGAWICSYPTTQCRAASCAGGVAKLAASCDGRGACPAPSMVSCGGLACNGAACLGGCASSLDCPGDEWCSSGHCIARSPLGTNCSAGEQCRSSFCADGVCCESACAGACQACGADGRCSLVSPSPVAGREPCPGGGLCAGRCDGQHSGCVFPGVDTVCRSASCALGVGYSAALCDGNGACGAPGAFDCAPYVCGAATCLSSCSSDADCVSNSTCKNGICSGGPPPPAVTCTSASDCRSGYCVDGFCCDRACDGACEACNISGHIGSCTAAPTCGSGDGGANSDAPPTIGVSGGGFGSCRCDVGAPTAQPPWWLLACLLTFVLARRRYR